MKVPAIVGVTGLCLLALFLFRDEDGEPPTPPSSVSSGGGGDLLTALRGIFPLPQVDLSGEPPADLGGPRFTIVTVRDGERVQLREAPGGELIATLGERTEFGSARSYWVARVEDGWLGVPTAERPNDRLGWIRDDRRKLELRQTNYWVLADISERRLELRYGKRRLESFTVTVGAPGSATPPGAYAITDGLAGKGVGPYYGCCILALNGHQPNLPPDWLGGDRIAIHGTPGEIGAAASAGCLRADDLDMVSLFARLPLGAPVFIRS